MMINNRWLLAGVLTAWLLLMVTVSPAAAEPVIMWWEEMPSVSTPVFAPAYSGQPRVTSPYYCLMDRSSGQVLLARNGDAIRPMASTTKMMTAILVMEYAGLDEIATVSKHADKTPEYTIGLREGQKIKLSELIKVALVRSANDAAVVLAEHVAGDEALFAHLMSQKAFLLGASSTHFCNASGLPANNHYSTACDLAQIGRYALAHPYVEKMVATAVTEFDHPGYGRPLTIHNTNNLLNSYPGADGIKTGTTNAAGKCLVASASRDKRQLIAVVLRSADRQGDCWRLLDQGFNKYHYQKIIDSQMPWKSLKVSFEDQDYVDIFPEQDLWIWMSGRRPELQKKVRMNYIITRPVTAGRKAGELSVYAEGRLVRTVSLVCGELPRKPGLFQKIFGSRGTVLLLPGCGVNLKIRHYELCRHPQDKLEINANKECAPGGKQLRNVPVLLEMQT